MTPTSEPTMQALWLEDQRLSLKNGLALPRPGIGEALVRVRLAGICGTDLELLRGYYPYAGIPGHEFVGEVVEAADDHLIGERVVGEINLSCGHCRYCLLGRPTHCERRSVLGIKHRHGAFADYLCLPIVNLHRVPDSVCDAAAVFCEPLAAALQIQVQIAIGPDHRVLVLGAGRLGQLIAQTLALCGCELWVLVRHPQQRGLLQARGIPCLVEADVKPGDFDCVIDATGSPSGFELARRAVRPGGTLVMKSTYRGPLTFDPSALVVDEITLVGSRCGPFPAALRLLQRGAVDPTGLISARYPLSQGLAAFDHAQRPGVLKVLLEPGA